MSVMTRVVLITKMATAPIAIPMALSRQRLGKAQTAARKIYPGNTPLHASATEAWKPFRLKCV